MKEAVTKVIDTLTQEDFHGAFQKLLEGYSKCIAAGVDNFEGEFHACTINKSTHTKKAWKLIVWTSYFGSNILPNREGMNCNWQVVGHMEIWSLW